MVRIMECKSLRHLKYFQKKTYFCQSILFPRGTEAQVWFIYSIQQMTTTSTLHKSLEMFKSIQCHIKLIHHRNYRTAFNLFKWIQTQQIELSTHRPHLLRISFDLFQQKLFLQFTCVMITTTRIP